MTLNVYLGALCSLALHSGGYTALIELHNQCTRPAEDCALSPAPSLSPVPLYTCLQLHFLDGATATTTTAPPVVACVLLQAQDQLHEQ
jgi:hypothetical protein